MKFKGVKKEQERNILERSNDRRKQGKDSYAYFRNGATAERRREKRKQSKKAKGR